MDDFEDPYEILGVSSTATAPEIKAAYRKLALRHHPDKQSTDQDKQQAHVVFAKISNAYEILSDETTRTKYDREQQQPQQAPEPSSYYSQQQQQPHYYYETPLYDTYGDHNDFFDNHHHQRYAQFHNHRTRHPFSFHDPFEIFSQVFGEEFGTTRHHGSQRGGHGDMNGMRDPFQAHRSSSGVFEDPFFNSSFGGGGLFGGHDVFSSMHQQMNMMNQIMQQQQQQAGGAGSLPRRGSGGGGGRAAPQVFYSSSSTSSFGGGGGGGGSMTSVSTTTRMINGKLQTVTERITTKPDGTVERHVETSGNPQGFASSSTNPPLQGQPQHPQLQGRRSSSSSSRRPTPTTSISSSSSSTSANASNASKASASARHVEQPKAGHPRPQLDDDDEGGGGEDQNKRSRFSWRRNN